VAITKERKQELVAQYNDILTNSDGFVIIETTGLTVKEVQDLRAKIRGANGQYVVAKNTLFRLALQNAGWPVPEKYLKGPVSVAFGKGSFPAVSKTVMDYVKDLTEKMKVKGGVMAGSVITDQQVGVVSSLPSLDEMRAQLAGLIVAPATGLVSAIHAATGQIVNVLQAYADKNGNNAA
jgi:large subunit ribosomal protein L10